MSENPTINRLAALIRAAGRFEYFKNARVKDFIEGNLEDSVQVILLMAKEFELKQGIIFTFLDKHEDS
jgi:hypothetical protein